MSIIAYVGLPGSGKSYSVVANQVIPALKQGRRVVTNIPLYRDAVRNVTPKGEIVELPLELIGSDPERLDEYATAGSVVIVDELWRLFPAGAKTNQVPEVFKSWLAEHRHRVDSKGHAMQVVFVTQDLSQIAAFSRQLVEQTFHHTKLSHVGMDGRFRVDVFHGPVTGAVPPKSNVIRSMHQRYRSEIFLMYKSHTMSEALGDGADEGKMDGRGNALRRPIIMFGIPGGIALVVWAGWSMAGILSADDGRVLGASVATAEDSAVATPVEESSEVQSAPRASASSRVGEAVSRVSPSVGYRVVGFMHTVDEGTGSAMIQVPDEGVVRVPWSKCWRPGDGLTHCRFDDHEVTEVSSERR